jgi:hypothetical protein
MDVYIGAQVRKRREALKLGQGGAFVAYEATAKLISSGRNVVFLCLLDPLPSFGVRRITPRAALTKIQSDFAGPDRAFLSYVDRLAFYIVFALKAFELARLHLLFVKKRSNVRDFVRNRKRLLTRLRGPTRRTGPASYGIPCGTLAIETARGLAT